MQDYNIILTTRLYLQLLKVMRRKSETYKSTLKKSEHRC
jgi:hypothetical protein